MNRRAFLGGIAAAAMILAAGPAFAATQSVTWNAAYTGADFSTPASMFAGVGSNLTYNDTGHTCPSTGSSTTIAVNAGVTSACIGHTVLWSGTRYMITSFNAGTQVATISGVAGYPATFSGTPTSGDAYTIDDVTITLQIGLSGASSNEWTISPLSLGAITTGVSNTITIQGNTAWSGPAGLNTSGFTSQPVIFHVNAYHSTALSTTPDYVTVKNLQILEFSGSGVALNMGGANCTIDSCFTSSGGQGMSVGMSRGAGNIIKNTCLAGSPSVFLLKGNITAYGCTFQGGPFPGSGGYDTLNFVACVFLGQSGLLNTTVTYSGCLTDQASPPSGCTTIAASGQIINNVSPYDLRPLTSGALPNSTPHNANLTVDMFGAARPSSGNITAGAVQTSYAAPTTQTVTFTCAYNGDFQFSNTDQTVFDTQIVDCTALSFGNVTQAGSTNTTLVLASGESADFTGHPVTVTVAAVNYTCLIRTYNTSTKTATLGALTVGGWFGSWSAAGLGSPPGAGVAYTINPIIAVLSVGYSALGQTGWSMTPTAAGNTAMCNISPTTSATNYVRITSALGPTGWAWNAANGIGSPVQGSGQIFVEVNANHQGIFFFNTDNILVDNLQLWCSGGAGYVTGGDGIAIYGLTTVTNVKFSLCMLRGDAFNSGDFHFPIFMGAHGNTSLGQGMQLDRCVVVDSSRIAEALSAGAYTANFCTLLSTENTALIASGTVAPGGTVIPVVSVTDIYSTPNGGSPYYPGWLGHPSITSNSVATSDIASINTGTPSITIITPTTGAIAIGDTIYVGGHQEMSSINAGGSPSFAVNDCAIFGFVNHKALANVTVSWARCATDANPTGQSGLTTMAYANQFMAASKLGNSGSIDARPKVGNGLGIANYNSLYPTDLFGIPYAAVNPTAGAIQFQTASSNTGIIGGGVGGGIISN